MQHPQRLQHSVQLLNIHMLAGIPLQFDIGSVTPCGRGPQYALWYAAPNTTTAREVLK